jgi:signal transduction histidine kinase
MTDSRGFVTPLPEHDRHTVARWLRPRSLRARLVGLVAVAGILIVGLATWFEQRAFERGVERDIEQAALGTSQLVIDVIEVGAMDDAQLTGTLHEFIRAVPAARSISVVSLDREAVVRASTSSTESPRVTEACRTAVHDGRPVWVDLAPDLRAVAVPGSTGRDHPWAVAVTASFGAVSQVRDQGRRSAIFALLAMVLLTVVVDVFFRRLVHRPLTAMGDTMARAGRGELDARVPVSGRDEIGQLGAALNSMLGLLESLTRDLNERVRLATAGLQAANVELVSSRQRVLALRQALARAEQLAAVGHMAANLAHEVGTPLNLVSGYVQMLLEDADRQPQTLERLRIVQGQIARVTDILRGVLDRARRPAVSAPTDVLAAWRRVLEIAQPTLDAAQITVEERCPAHGPLVLADPAELELVFQNLVVNSVDAMPAGGRLTFSVEPAGDDVLVDLADTGTGIDADLLPHVFDPWVTTKPAGAGTGLGLAICREIITRHEGRIAASSRAGEGAVFSLVFRRAADDGARAS